MNISGRILNEQDDNPVIGARVDIIVGEKRQAGVTSGSDGGFQFSRSGPPLSDDITLTVTKEGYHSAQVTKSASEGDLEDWLVRMKPNPVPFPWWMVGAGAATVVGLTLILALIFSGTKAPDLIAKTVEEAEAELTKLKLALGEIIFTQVEDDREGAIIGQHPAAGARVRRNAPINLTVADARTVALPNLQGKLRAEAEELIKSLGLSIASVILVETDEVPDGTVIRHDPIESDSVPRSASIELIVATPIPRQLVPNVVDKNVFEAMEVLRAAGFQIRGPDTREVANHPPNTVIQQDPEGDTEARQGAEVSLVVAVTQPPVNVPPVLNLGRREAEKRISTAGLRSNVRLIQKGGHAPGTVFAQNPTPDIPVPRNTVVELDVVANPPPVHRQGRLTLKLQPLVVNPQTGFFMPLPVHMINVDLDAGRTQSSQASADLIYVTGDKARLNARRNRRLGVIGREAPFGPADCKEALLRNSLPFLSISTLNTWVATHTTGGRYTAFRLVRSPSRNELQLEYITWEKVHILIPDVRRDPPVLFQPKK